MIDDVQKLLNDYQVWLKDRTVLRQIDDWVEITTPYLDRHNDYVQIYAKKTNGGFTLTDDGYTIDDLEQGGCKPAGQAGEGDTDRPGAGGTALGVVGGGRGVVAEMVFRHQIAAAIY
jgi:hypothetical protein